MKPTPKPPSKPSEWDNATVRKIKVLAWLYVKTR